MINNATIIMPAIARNVTKAALPAALRLVDIPLFSAQYLPATTLICLVLTWICSSAGIGGAALDSVVFISIMGLTPKEVSPITKALVFGESLGGYLINMRRRHPFVPRTLVNYEVALAFEPFSLLGTLWGVYANQSFPSYIILAGLILVLGFATIRTFQKGWALFRTEQIMKTRLEGGQKDENNEDKTIEVEENAEKKDTEKENNIQDEAGPEDKPDDDDEDEAEHESNHENKKKKKSEKSSSRRWTWRWFTGKDGVVPFWTKKISGLLFMNWVILALFNVLIGTTALGVKCGSDLYWGTLSITIPVFIFIAIMMALLLKKKYKKRKANNYEYTPADLKWSPRRIGVFMTTSLFTGILAAMFGLGGGTINSPMMLELGVLPAQVPATSGLLILITSSVAIIQYLALGRIQYDYLLWFICVGFIGGVSGHLGVRYYIKKYQKQSTIVFLLGFLVLAGMVVLIYTITSLFISKTAVMSISSPCAK